MAGEYRMRIKGLESLKEALLNLAPALRRKRAARALRKGAEPVIEAATRVGVVPVLQRPIYRRGKLWRKPGTVRDAIRVRSSKETNRTGDVGVFVNVRPARGADRGGDSPNDPFYWRWLHFGAKTVPRPKPFLTIGARELPTRSLQAIERALGEEFKQMELEGFKR